MSLSNLSILNVSGNKFSGSMPIGIGNLQQLSVLNLSKNGFSGTIPSSIGTLYKLTVVDLSGQNFSGEIPFDLAGLPNLQVIALQQNKLSGNVPEGFSSLLGMQYLNLSSNSLSGHIPSTFGFLTSLVVLSLSNNHINGSIPPDLANCSALEDLDLHSNSLSGQIPADLGRLSLLSVLDLGRNNLTLSNLTVLDLSTNNFSGEIPANLTMLSSLGLCGEPLERCETSGNGGNKLIMFIAVAASGAPLLLSCCCLYTYNLLRWRRKLKEKAAGEKKHSPSRASSRTSGGRGSGENGGPKLVMFNNKITLAETIEATREFDEEHMDLSENMFRKEAESLGKVKHRNLTVLRGYYAGPPNLRLLVYDYMPNGNLATLLQEASHQDGHVLNWPMRHLIALGIARGLAFLHSSSMVHGDIKPQNVLFDADFEAHLSEFGLCKLVVATPSPPHQLQLRGQISELLEPGLLELDPESSEWEEFLLGIKVGLLCTAPDPLDRRTMADIVFMLEGCRVGPDIASSADPTCQPSPA
ncbi:hypothetical protein CQW23_11360 [Capsicum baccatum]|uniref:Protein kinase domain-containing protein n=1 Tax=Capsicum baccatum TaxID=33114 RepID=A0A2G2WPK4_CAPBA|nr:hypothetical protein CQW23_11360 [Capsicum baccatum]